jgi:hypothetical protein
MKEDISGVVPRIQPLLSWLTPEQNKEIGERAIDVVARDGPLSAAERAYRLAKTVSSLKRELLPKSGECCFVVLHSGVLFTGRFVGYHEPTWALRFARLPFSATQDGPSLVLERDVKWIEAIGEHYSPPLFEAELARIFRKNDRQTGGAA